MKIAFISCTKLKQSSPCTAKEMYLPSALFRKASSFVEQQNYDDWFILSTKHGLLSKKDVIEPYDVTLLTMKATERRQWAQQVMEQLQELELFSSIVQIDFYAGRPYRQYLIPLLEKEGISCHVPLQGLGILQQLGFYKRYEENRIT